MRTFLVLLLLGQIFLIGAIKGQSSNTNDEPGKIEIGINTPVSETNQISQEPEIEPDKGVFEQASDSSSEIPNEEQKTANRTEPIDREKDREIEKENQSENQKIEKSEKPEKLKDEKLAIIETKEFENQNEKTIQIVFSKFPEIETVNSTNSLLRIRITPKIASIIPEFSRICAANLRKHTIHESPDYTEMLFFPRNFISKPNIATSTSGFPILEITLRDSEWVFPVKQMEYIEKGLNYYVDRPKTKHGFSDAYILKYDASENGLSLFPVLANEGICQREILSSMANRYDALAAINAAYFVPPKGDPIGTLIINKRLISSPLFNRSVFGITQENLPIFGNPDFSGNFIFDSSSVPIDGINQPRKDADLVIYTPEYGKWTLTSGAGLELVLTQGRVIALGRENSLIPPDGVVVSTSGEKAKILSKVRLGDNIRLEYSVNQPWNRVIHAVCGGPRLLKDGEIKINGRQEHFDSTICYGRHPRTAVALTDNGDVLLIVIDGRSAKSAGMTLEELAAYIKNLGGRQAMNLDGGGSSSMFVKGRIVNHPSDGKERPISNGLVITKKD
ncbi:MAG: phosphodiester glycosidase family protein [Candidatus Riflebacteria bacterium]|nr:phosphodiester glycosidase family protein [Candidatus Riflebacteria bacterium]